MKIYWQLTLPVNSEKLPKRIFNYCLQVLLTDFCYVHNKWSWRDTLRKFSPRYWNTGLVPSGVILTSWWESASLALFDHPSSDGVTMKSTLWGRSLISQPCFLSFPISMVKIEWGVRSVETDLQRRILVVAVVNVDTYAFFWPSQIQPVILRVQE